MSTPTPPRPATTPVPVTVDRVRTVVSRRGDFVREIPDGVVGRAGGRLYEAVVLGERDLRLRTRWNRLLPRGSQQGAAQLINDWNRDRLLPTLHSLAVEGGFTVVAAHSTPIGLGLTDPQLTEVLDVYLAVVAQAMAALDASVPAPPTPETGDGGASADPDGPPPPAGGSGGPSGAPPASPGEA